MDDALFYQYWQEWEKKLKDVAKRGAATLEFPRLSGPAQDDAGFFVYKPASPLVLHDVRHKGSSGKPGRFSIFIDGSFKFRKENGAWLMASAGANISIFELSTKDEDVTATLFDALHFDFEEADAQKPFHPIFHVQRGGNGRLTDDVVKALIQAHRGALSVVSVEQGKIPGSHHLRIPSPQLDYFSVLVMVIADFFCNPEEKDPSKNMAVLFKDILTHLCDDRNIARQGIAAQALFKRNEGRGWATSADWYAESVVA
jgi:hypothetical protein